MRPTPAFLLATVAVFAACAPDATSPPVPFTATAAELTALNAAVEDAGTRLISGLTDRQLAGELEVILAELSQHIEANRADRARTTLDAAEQVLARTAAGAPSADGPDRAAIELALIQVAVLLDR